MFSVYYINNVYYVITHIQDNWKHRTNQVTTATFVQVSYQTILVQSYQSYTINVIHNAHTCKIEYQ